MKKIDANMWREILSDKAKAKEALVELTFEGDNGELVSVKEVQLENGKTIPVKNITEEQAHAFMSALCPDWAKN